MSRTEDVQTAIWSDEDYDALSLEAGLLYLWSFTNPRCNGPGLYKVTTRNLLESKVPQRRLEPALAELAAASFVFVENGYLWVRSRVKHLRTRSPNHAKGIANDLALIDDDHALKQRFLQMYADEPWLRDAIGHFPRLSGPKTEGVSEPLRRASETPSEPLPRGLPGSAKPNAEGASEPLRRGSEASQGSGTGSGIGSGLGSTATPQSEADELPEDLPAECEPFVEPVREVLVRIAERRPGSITPTRPAVAAALRQFPHRDFLPIAFDYEHWLSHGTGQSKVPKDAVAGYRNQLRNKPDVLRKTELRQGDGPVVASDPMQEKYGHLSPA